VKILTLRTLFHTKLSSLYDEREIDAIFFIYIDDKYGVKKYEYFLNQNYNVDVNNTDIELLANGMPIQYVTGKATFYDLQISVNPSVLIPRAETEELVRYVIYDMKYANCDIRESKISNLKSQILDIGTGSGAIAIALAKKIEDTEIWATDISEEALETTKKNAKDCHANIRFLQHDILKDDITLLPDNVDIIISNPPYIPLCEQSSLHKNIVNFEPSSALFVPDENPLIYYEAIAKTAKKILRKGGVLYFETHEKFHLELSTIFTELDFKEIKFRNDLNGKPRFAIIS
jgi:release factor glutamine methyltransferase